MADLTRTRFCDSAGHTLIAAHSRARAEGRAVLLARPGFPVLRVLALTGVDRVIPSFTTVTEALAQPAAGNGRSGQRTEGDVMPRTSRYVLPSAGDLPGTLKRSPKEAQDMFTRALTSAVQEYGESDQAYRAAYAELKRTFEKRGDHWIPKQDQPR